MKELLNRVESFINLEEKLNTQFNNPFSVDASSNRPTEK